jgi:hypothetical protein
VVPPVIPIDVMVPFPFYLEGLGGSLVPFFCVPPVVLEYFSL